MTDLETWACSICLESNSNDQKYILKPCNHTFHLECIIESLRRYGPKCPNCRDNPYENDNKNENILTFNNLIDSVISHTENYNYHVYDLDPFTSIINQLSFRLENNNIHPIFDIAGNDISNIFNNIENNDEDNTITNYDNNYNDILDLSNLSDISLSSLNITDFDN